MLAGAWVALPTHAVTAASQQVDAETIRQEIIAGKAVDHDGHFRTTTGLAMERSKSAG